MADKPTTLPEWASTEETDPVSGQLNRVEPPTDRKESGWTRREIPPRQWWNWLLWRIWQWLKWVDAGTHQATASTIMERDANGRSKAANPSASGDVVNRGWADGRYLLSDDTSDNRTFADGRYLLESNNLSDLDDVPSARDNLGLDDRYVQSGSEDLPIFFVRAWANFNGDGSVTIRGSGNINSIVRDANGEYTVTFVTSMPDADYSVTVGECHTVSGPLGRSDSANPHSFSSSGFSITSWGNDDTIEDIEIITFQVVR